MGLIGRIMQVAGIVVLLVVGLGAFLYFTDYAVGAELTERGTDSQGNFVIAKTKIGGYAVTQYLDGPTYSVLDARCFGFAKMEDNPCFVTYTIQTKALRVYAEEGGELLYES